MDLLGRLLPDSERSLESFLKIADREVEDVLDELDNDRGIIEQRLSQVVDEDMAKKMADFYGSSFEDKMRITFVFENEIDYYRAIQYFGRKPDVNKLMSFVYEQKEKELTA